MDRDEKIARILLNLGLETKVNHLRPLLREVGSAVDILRLPEEKLRACLSAESILKIKDSSLLRQAEKEYQRTLDIGIELPTPEEETYPQLLTQCHDAPLLLYKQGTTNINNPHTLSVVGTRNPSPYGKRLVERIITDLIPYQPLIVSGLAYGIDVHTHRNALDMGLETVAVLGSGLCSIYPADHKDISKEMTKRGALVSEYALDAKPRLHHFPIRNRIIAGMSQATLVVESKVKGGAMITAYLTLDYNRELMTLPHSIFSEGGSGCLHLIKQGMSHLITSGDDIAEILGWKKKDDSGFSEADQARLPLLSEQEETILQLIKQQDSVHIDTLRNHLADDSQTLSFALLNLEMNKLIKKLPGNFYQQT